MRNAAAILCSFLILLRCLTTMVTADELYERFCADRFDNSTDFNEIKFTQTWGHAECLDFKEGHGHEASKCRYEDKPSIFSIHGIWPSQTGTQGPNCCEKIKFNHELLDPIYDKLDLYWYEISATRDPFDFWGHEWIKHGSCAKVLDAFSTELKYFQAGLTFREKFDLYKALKNAEISPQTTGGKRYPTELIHQAFRQEFGVNPYVQCLRLKTGEIHLLAVEICLDRNLNPIDCSTHDTRHWAAEFGNALPCPPGHEILYEDPTIPTKRAEL